MRVEARFDTESITLSIIDSRNFDQSGSRIHHGAFARLSNLEVEIRRSLGEVVRQGLDRTAPDRGLLHGVLLERFRAI